MDAPSPNGKALDAQMLDAHTVLLETYHPHEDTEGPALIGRLANY